MSSMIALAAAPWRSLTSWGSCSPVLHRLPPLHAARIEDFMGRKASKAEGAQATSAPPPPPPAAQVLGRPVLKDFVDEETGELRPFKGEVIRVLKGGW